MTLVDRIKAWFGSWFGKVQEPVGRAATAQDVDAHAETVMKNLEFKEAAQLRPGEDHPDIPPAPCKFWIDVYLSPKGAGYVLNYELERNGQKMRKSINVGPESYRSRDWEEVRSL